MGFKAEVCIGGNTFGQGAEWVSNSLVFDTPEEAEGYAIDLFSRWTSVTKYRVAPTDKEPNHSFNNGQLTKKGE